MQDFSKATDKGRNAISIASDYVGTLSGNPKLTNLLATQILRENEVKVFSSHPPTGRLLEMFLISTEAYLTPELSEGEFKTLTNINEKPVTPKEHFNIVFDDQDVEWCTYDYHIQAGTMAFDEFLKEHEKDPYKNLMNIAKELSDEFEGYGINVETYKTSPAMKKHL